MGLRFRRSALSHLELPDDGDFDGSTFVIEGYFRVEAQPTTGQTYTLISKGRLGATKPATFYLAYLNDAGTLKLRCGFVDGTSTTRSVTGTLTLTTGRWYALAGAFNGPGDDMRLYYSPRATPNDASAGAAYTELATSVFAGAVPSTNSEPVRVGCGVAASGALEDGASVSVSEIRIYRSGGAQATLEGRLNNRLYGNETANLVYLGRCDEYAGTTAHNSAPSRGSRIDGTLRNGAHWCDDPLELYYPDAAATPVTTGLIAYNSLALRPGASWSVTTGTASTAYPVTNLDDPLPARPFRYTAAGGPLAVTLDAGASPAALAPVQVVVIAGHNLTSDSTTTVYADDESSFTSPPISAFVPYHVGTMVYVLPRPSEYRFWRVEMTDTSSADGYIEIGTVALLTAWELLDPPALAGEEHALVDPSTAIVAAHGTRTATSRARSHDIRFDLGNMRAGHARGLWYALEEAAGGAPVWVCPDVRRALYRGRYGVLSALPSSQPADRMWHRVRLGPVAVEAYRS